MRQTLGNYANKCYTIQTHSGKRVFDILNGKADENQPVIQYDSHNGENQMWFVVPADQPFPQNQNQNQGYQPPQNVP